MSCRSGMGVIRGGTTGLQPLRATVPFQLHNKTQPGPRDAKTAEKTKLRPPKPSIRRTLSLDTIVGPYLQGQWPKELDSQGIYCMNDKATQTPSSWTEEVQGKRAGGVHKRSASWGSAEHLREIAKLKQQLQQRSKQGSRGGRDRERHPPPLSGSHSPGATQTMPLPIPLTPLSKLTPRLRHSVEGLNQELEGVFVCGTPDEQHRFLEVPDGHKAPVPPQSCSSGGSQSDPSPALLSTTSSPCSSLSPCALGDAATDTDTDAELIGCGMLCPSPSPPLSSAEPSPLELSSSPRPNKSYSFQREPPEGCERVRVCEEALSPCLGQASFLSSCPDPNKVNFTTHGGSAFCPVSLLKPLLPSMDILFRSLSVSPVTGCSGQGGAAYQPAPPGVGVYLGPLSDSATTAM
ncbi:protein FAM117A-like [Anguilla anguilla]|uniref:protein FAM117A-like n=1 Tax=Anguilla anguilla TaxID=7936 RepID=UPI0015ACBEB1|nr:protein FAM117A-like [Anguilla anguilla]